MKSIKKEKIYDALLILFGAALYSAAVNSFLVPSGILPGGLTGIAAAVSQITPVGKGALLLAFNLPILYTGLKKIGTAFILKTAAATALLSAALDIQSLEVFIFKGERMLSALSGGVLLGAGIGLIMLRGATTGGTDIIAKLINGKHPAVSIGRVILIGDIISISLSGIVFGDVSSILYSLIAVYTASRVTDLILYGSGGGKTVFIITGNGEEVSKTVSLSAHRGATLIRATGGFTGKSKTVVFCACRRDEINKVIKAAREVDTNAFITVLDAGDVIGEGFKR